MTMTLDIEARLIAYLIAWLKADATLAGVVSDRVYAYRDASHKAAYPCVTVQVVSCAATPDRLGWYRAAVNLIAHSHLHDDQSGAVVRQTGGILRGIAQSELWPPGNTEGEVEIPAQDMTLVDVDLGDSFDESDGNMRTVGLTLSIVVRPSTGDNNG